MAKYKIISAYRNDTEDDDLTITSEVTVNPHAWLTLKDIERLIEDILETVGDSGDIEYDWEIAPAIVTDRHPQEHHPAMEVRLVPTTTCGRMSYYGRELNGSIESLRRIWR